MNTDLRSADFSDAVGAIERRAERQDSELTLFNTYVDSGVLSELSSTESQVIYGRRGVGESHLLYFHGHQIKSKPGCNPHLIFNCQLLGSGTASISTDPKVVSHNYAFEFLNDLGTKLFDLSPSFKLASADERNAQTAALCFVEHVLSKDGSFDYRNLAATFDAYLNHINAERIYIVLDEFVSIPQSAQPLFVHILKQVFATNNKVVIKLAAVTHQTTLYAFIDGQQIGLEIGADVFSDIDLDSYFLWDENREFVLLFLSQVLYNHLGETLQWDLMLPPSRKKEKIISELFTQEKCLQELIRASEGNCRDLLNIFRISHAEFRRGLGQKISLEHVTTGSKLWFRNAKLANLSRNTKDEEFLNFLIQGVIKNKKSRSFMVTYQDARHPLLTRLLNLRLLHRLRTTWTHPDRPGEPFSIFTIDYGYYVDLKGTRSEPHQEVF